MNRMDQIEACFDSLGEVRDRLSSSYQELSKYEEKLKNLRKQDNLTVKDNFMIRILAEITILNLYKFGEINDKSLNKILKELDTDFLKSIQKCLKPFKEMMPEIRRYRHFVAHSEKRSKKMSFYYELDKNFEVNFPKFRFLAVLVVYYIDCIFENFSDILKNTELTRNLKIQHFRKSRKKDRNELEKYQNNIEMLMQDINSNLDRNGFKNLRLWLYISKSTKNT